MSSTNLTDFRNQYLARAKTRLTAVDLANSDESSLILAAAVLRSYDSVNRFDAIIPEAIAPLELMTGAELDVYLQDASNRQSFELVLSSAEAMKALAASNTAMGAVATSMRAMAAIATSSTAMTAFVASSTAMGNLISSTSAMATIGSSSIAMSIVAVSANATNLIASSASALSSILTGAPARAAIWSSSTALSAIQNAPQSVITALQTHPRALVMLNNPSNLASAFLLGRSITLQVRNLSGVDTNFLRTLAGGSGAGDESFSTSTTFVTRVRAYNNLSHFTYSNNFQFHAYVLDMN